MFLLLKKNAPNVGAFGVLSEYELVAVHLTTTNASSLYE